MASFAFGVVCLPMADSAHMAASMEQARACLAVILRSQGRVQQRHAPHTVCLQHVSPACVTKSSHKYHSASGAVGVMQHQAMACNGKPMAVQHV